MSSMDLLSRLGEKSINDGNCRIGIGEDGDPQYTITKNHHHAIFHEEIKIASGKDFFPTIAANCGSKQWSGNQEALSGDFHIIQNSTIRRLTPVECERLQGFRDSYTECMGTDGHRYKALGNSWAVPQAAWVIGRVVEAMLR